MLFFFLKNPFLSKKLSQANLDKLTKAHLSSLQAANKNGSFKALIADTQQVYDAFLVQVSTQSSSQTEKEGKTISVKAMAGQVRKFITTEEKNITYQFTKGSADYQDFFPRGLTEYSKAGVDTLVLLFERFVKAYEKQAPKLGDDRAKKARQLCEAYRDARKTQVDKKETIRDLADVKADQRTRLAIQLYHNLGLLITLNAAQPELINNYFNFSFLSRSKPRTTEAIPAK